MYDEMIAATMTRRRALLQAGAAGLALTSVPAVLSACGGGSASTETTDVLGATPSAKRGGVVDTLNWGSDSQLSTVDGVRSNSYDVLEQLVTLADGLVIGAPDGTPQPLLASKIEQPNDTTYIFTIRDGVTFWNGDALTVGDIIFSIKRHLDPKKPSASAAAYPGINQIKTIKQTGARQITITLKAVTPSFLQTLAIPAFWVVQEKFAKAAGARLGTPGKWTWMGTGPMKIQRFSGDGFTYVRNDAYWGEPANVKTFVFKYIPDENARLLAMKGGEINFAESLSSTLLPQWAKVAQIVNPTNTPAILSWQQRAPFDDINVRKAFAYALDRDQIVKSLFNGYASPMGSILPSYALSGTMTKEEYASLLASLPKYEYDLDKAKAAIKASRYPSGFSVTAIYAKGFGDPLGQMLLVLQENLAAAGVKINVKGVLEDEFYEVTTPKKQAPLIAWFAGAPVSDTFDNLAIEIDPANAANPTDWKNPTAITALRKGTSTLDKAVRKQALIDILTSEATEISQIPVMESGFPWAFGNGVQFDTAATDAFIYFQRYVSAVSSKTQ